MHLLDSALLVLASLLLAVPAGSSRGDLDPTFSGDGWVRTCDIDGYSKQFFPKGAANRTPSRNSEGSLIQG